MPWRGSRFWFSNCISCEVKPQNSLSELSLYKTIIFFSESWTAKGKKCSGGHLTEKVSWESPYREGLMETLRESECSVNRVGEKKSLKSTESKQADAKLIHSQEFKCK